MRRLGAIVQAFVLAVFDSWRKIVQCCVIGPEFVSHQHPRLKNNAVTKVGYGWGDSGDYTLEVLNDRTEKVSEGNYDLKVETRGRTTHVEADDVLTVEGERRVKVTRYMGLESEEMTHRADKALKIEGEVVEVIGRSETKIGKTTVKVDGKDIKIAATQELVLSCGASSIVLNATGVTIVGPLVKIN